MSRGYSDFELDRTDPAQPELGFPAGRREGGTEAASQAAEPARAEFFRAKRRPLLPLLGLFGAVATILAFAWLGGEGADPPAEPVPALAPGELAPVATAPDFELPFPDATSGSAPGPGSLAATPQEPLPAPPAVPSVLDAPAPPGGIAPESPAPAPPAAEPAIAWLPPAPPAPAVRPAPAAAARSAYAVQLLAARSETQVGAAWEKLRSTYPDLLASLEPSVGRTSRSGGETFYRLRAGPLPDRAAADALCKALSARQQSCFVVSPGS